MSLWRWYDAIIEGKYPNIIANGKYKGKILENLNKLKGVLFPYIFWADFRLKYSNKDKPIINKKVLTKFDICRVYPGSKLDIGRIGTDYCSNSTANEVGKTTKIMKYSSNIM